MTSPDFYPTFLAAAGLPLLPDQHTDGVDVTPLLRGEEFQRGPIFWHYPHYSNQGGTPSAGMREGRWKVIYPFETERTQLYDLTEDIGETTDLATREPATAARLTATLLAWLDTVQTPRPRPNPHPAPFEGLAGYYLGGQPTQPPGDMDDAPDHADD
jgi:arylsulfatase A-like enzyme